MRALAVGALLLCGSAAMAGVPVDLMLLSEKYGRPLTIGRAVDAREGLQPAALTGVAAAEAFHALCLAKEFSAESLDAAAAASPLGLTKTEAMLPEEGKNPAVRLPRWTGASAIASFWAGDESGLKGRPILIRDRGVSVTGPYGPFKAMATQCNLSLATAGVADLQPLADRLVALSGGKAGKIVIKPAWADGSILLADGRRISFAVVNADKPTAFLHFTVQKIEGAQP